MRVIVSLFALLVACVIAHDIEGANLVPFTTSEAIVERWLETGRPVFVAHTATWCGHCKHFISDAMIEASNTLTSIDWMNIDCPTDGEEHCKNMRVRSYPTLKYFTGAWHDYEGERTVEALADLVESIKDLKEEWNGSYTTAASVELPADDFVEPIELVNGPRWEEKSFGAIEEETSPRIVIFGDVREEHTQEVYATIDKVIREKEATWPYPVSRIERRREMNAEIFGAPGFDQLPLIFFIAPGANGPRYYDGEQTEAAIAEHIDDMTAPVDFDKEVTMFKTGSDLTKIVETTGKPVAVSFMASYCGHCHALKPIIARAAQKSTVGTFAAIMCDSNDTTTCTDMGINGYPSVFIFDGATFTPYNGSRSVGGLLQALAETPVQPVTEEDPIAAFKAAHANDNVEDETVETEEVEEVEVVEVVETPKEKNVVSDIVETAKQIAGNVAAKVELGAQVAVEMTKNAVNKAKNALAGLLDRHTDEL